MMIPPDYVAETVFEKYLSKIAKKVKDTVAILIYGPYPKGNKGADTYMVSVKQRSTGKRETFFFSGNDSLVK